MRRTPVPKELDEKYSRALSRILIARDNAFYASLVLNTEMYWSEEIGTAGTTGTAIIYAPSFVEKLTTEELMGLILHECMHIVYAHVLRCNGRNPQIWNIAADHVINTGLKQAGYKLPEGGCCNMKYLGWTTEDVYEDIYDEEQQKQQSGNSSLNMPDLLPPEMSDGDDENGKQQQPQAKPNASGDGQDIPMPTPAQIEEHAQAALQQAITSAEVQDQAGSIPGDLKRYLDKLLNPILPWDQILRKFLFSMSKRDFSWKKANRRYLHNGMHLPTMYGESIGQIDFAIDTSGSVSEADFNRFISEIAFVFKKFKPTGVGVFQFDHILQSTDKVTSLAEFTRLEFKGGGGTNIEPVLEHFKTKSKGKALIVLTDGYFHRTEDMNPQKPVVWLIYGNPKWQPPFGTAIYFEN